MRHGTVEKIIIDVHTVVDGSQIDRYFTMIDGTLIHCSTDTSAPDTVNRWYEICDKMPRIIVDGAQ